MIESYLIHIFFKLFFEIKGKSKNFIEKGKSKNKFIIIEEMKEFIENRERDIDILDPYATIIEMEDWV